MPLHFDELRLPGIRKPNLAAPLRAQISDHVPEPRHKGLSRIRTWRQFTLTQSVVERTNSGTFPGIRRAGD